MSNKLLTMYQSTNTSAKGITPNPQKRNNLIKHLSKCLKMLNAERNEREGSQRNTFRDQLLNYAILNHDINGVGNIDIAIKHHDGNVGVIFEYKKPDNVAEMMHPDNLNAKGFQELIQYYLGQITGLHTDGNKASKNTDRIVGIVTNGFSWYIINNANLYNYFGRPKTLKQQYIKWFKGQAGSNTTRYLRTTFITGAIDKALKNGIRIGHFDLSKMMNRKTSLLADRYQNMFYRFLSSQNLLHEDLFNDTNTLNRTFYNELLYLMGLKEVKSGNSKIIKRDTSQDSTLVNNIIDRLLDTAPNLSSDQLNNVAIQLTVVWMNRFLFLKLLEAQLCSFNGSKDYEFLTNANLKNFNDVYDLFFDVLARRPNFRRKSLQDTYSKVPYLNSSLFEPTNLEQKYLNINQIGNRPVNVYKDTSVRAYKKKDIDSVPILQYIVDFLNSFDFSTTSKHGMNNHSDLINASVLGLIFEKINGYKDGAYFTPGWICMFMANKAIKDIVLTKINKYFHKHYRSLEDVKFVLINSSNPIEKANVINSLINSIKICDPSVGSGHFLVSALNELIAVKSYLGVLFDANGQPARFHCSVNNDELVTTLDGKPYYYKRNDKSTAIVQETLFKEKRYLIENCLFGVDINPNSVVICHLRLWIELLKDAYYQPDGKGNEQLTTMPNIDINIKAKNSLIHHYPLDSANQLNQTLFNRYRSLINTYKNSDDKNIESIARKKIQLLRIGFDESIYTSDRRKYLNKIAKALSNLNKAGQMSLDGKPQSNINYHQAKKNYQTAVKDYHNVLTVDPFYENENGMEWRSEFPEVLSTRGRFKGFDVIIGNPPYIRSRNNMFSKDEKKYYDRTYELARYQINTYHLFIELAFDLLKHDGTFAYIVPNTMLTVKTDLPLRQYLVKNVGNLSIINSEDKLFSDAQVDNCLIFFDKCKPNTITFSVLKHHELYKIGTVKRNFFKKNNMEVIFSASMVKHQDIIGITDKMNQCNTLGSIALVKNGVKTYEKGKGTPPQTQDDKDNRVFNASTQKDDSYKKYLFGADVDRYQINWGSKKPKEKWIKYGKNLAAMRDPRLFNRKRILVRQIVNRHKKYAINADYIDEKGVISSQSTDIIENSKINLLFILGVINSRVESVWFAIANGELQRKSFPRVTLTRLKSFPIPKANLDQIKHLADLVTELRASVDDKDKANQLNNAIDTYVMDLYGLSDEDQQKVRNFKF